MGVYSTEIGEQSAHKFTFTRLHLHSRTDPCSSCAAPRTGTPLSSSPPLAGSASRTWDSCRRSTSGSGRRWRWGWTGRRRPLAVAVRAMGARRNKDQFPRRQLHRTVMVVTLEGGEHDYLAGAQIKWQWHWHVPGIPYSPLNRLVP